MKILVTGYEGFIGRNMTSYLAQATDWKIDGWSWDSDKSNWPKLVQYDWVIHLGAATKRLDHNIESVLLKNFEFSQWLFKECQHHGVNLQYASSSAVYGNTKDYSEYAELNPQTPYAWSKFLFDRWVFQQNHYSFVQGFRYFDVYGKWMHLKGNDASVIHKWREDARKKGYIEVWEGAEHIKRDWVWVGDVCRLHLDFIDTVKGSGIWNVGTGLCHSFLDIAEEIASQENVEIRTIPVPEEEQLRMRNVTCADLTHLKETVGKRKWLNVYEWLSTE